MESEDLFEEYTEEIITELDQENVIIAELENEIEEETEDLIEANGFTEQNTNESNNITETTKESDKTTQLITQTAERDAKVFQLPLARIRNLMKLDPDLHIASNEALFAVTRSTELFISSLAREAYIFTVQAKKKTIQKRDVDMAIAAIDSLMFLEGAMNF